MRSYGRTVNTSDMCSLLKIKSLPFSNVGVLPREVDLNELKKAKQVVFRYALLEELIGKLAITHSDKVFTPVSLRRDTAFGGLPSEGSRYLVHRVVVWHVSKGTGDLPTQLGDIWAHDDVIHLGNGRISAGLQRGSSRKTIKIDRAVSIFNRNFYPVTPAELLETRAEGLRIGIRQGRHKVYDTDELYKKLTGLLRPHIHSHLDEFIELAHTIERQGGIHASQFDRYPKALEEANTIKDVIQHMDDLEGCVVIIKGADYYVSNSEHIYKSEMMAEANAACHQFVTDTLPTDVKRGVGMLKLLKDGTYLQGVGYRLTADTFYIQNVVYSESKET